jgi:hypothetical protein
MPLENHIQRGDLVQRLVRALEIKGTRSPALGLDNLVAPIVILDDLTKQNEWVSSKDRGACIGNNSAAVAAERSGVAIVNPAGSGIIVAVDSVVVSLSTAADVRLQLVDQATIEATYIATQQCFWTDERNAGFTTAMLRSGSDPAIIASNAMVRIRVGSANPFAIWTAPMMPIIVQAGRAILAECDTVNQGFSATFYWREISEP